ncbi:MAG TPA: alpha/beta hydrolase [Anaerolineales bacterium]|nr:alpha/beta hydrolase [Anaerolineales bacterium]
MSAILLNQAIVHYEALGRGRPIVFLHGWVGSWRYWISSMQVASTSYRAYALDLFGYGDTTHDPLCYSLEKQAALVSGFLDAMGIGKIAIVGHGLGALVGFYFAAQQPGSVDRIMAVSSPLDANSIHARWKTSDAGELVEWLSNRTSEALIALSDAGKSDPRAAAASMSSFQANGLFNDFRAVNVPCLLVYGQNDPSIRAPSPDTSTNMGMHVHQVNLDESGHFPMLDESAKFNRLLTDFLALESGISPRELQLKEEWKRRVR